MKIIMLCFENGYDDVDIDNCQNKNAMLPHQRIFKNCFYLTKQR